MIANAHVYCADHAITNHIRVVVDVLRTMLCRIERANSFSAGMCRRLLVEEA